jgi:hypothetical protein
MKEGSIFLDLSPDVKDALRGVDLAAELKREGIEVQVEYGRLPTAGPQQERTREVALILLAAGVTAALIGSAIAKIIDARSRRPVTVTERRMVPARDSTGNEIRDGQGNQVFEEHTLITETENKHAPQEKSSIEVGFGSILTFKMSSGS